MKPDIQDLISRAIDARQNAVAPFSNFKVGAALLSKDSRIYTGCNIENASYGLGMCAERVALWKAVSEGSREFVRIAIVTEADVLTTPCGACRQLLWEYCGDIALHLHSVKGLNQEYRLSELLPHPFDKRSLM
ncbi:MAG TPA: cytidine deaminase [Terriglobia bacterium]|nr:cytidine deaminase [Terriglobia bacterium]